MVTRRASCVTASLASMRWDDLDFVLITGDVMDLASDDELDTFLEILDTLRKPWHFVPGNHDGFIHPDNPLAFEPHQAVARIDPRMAEPQPHANQAFWSRSIGRGIQLIGLDSRLPSDWGGTIRPPQLDWLQREIDRHSADDDLVIIAVHHPLHALGPHNRREPLNNFICDNGAVVERILRLYPSVKMVLSGHHHANQITLRDGRLHIASAGLGPYPCVYRIIQLEDTPDGWHATVDTYPIADDSVQAYAREVAMEANIAQVFEPGNPAAWVAYCVGQPRDLKFKGLIGN